MQMQNSITLKSRRRQGTADEVVESETTPLPGGRLIERSRLSSASTLRIINLDSHIKSLVTLIIQISGSTGTSNRALRASRCRCSASSCRSGSMVSALEYLKRVKYMHASGKDPSRHLDKPTDHSGFFCLFVCIPGDLFKKPVNT